LPTTSPMPHATAMDSRVRRDTSAEVIKPELTPSKREAHPFSCSHPNPESITCSDAQGPGPSAQPAFPGPPSDWQHQRKLLDARLAVVERFWRAVLARIEGNPT
jgi:hypothetical protein